MAKNNELPAMISGELLSSLTGLTPRRHRQLAEEGHYPLPIRHEYQFAKTIRALFDYYRKRTEMTESEKAAHAEKLRLTKAQADDMTLRNEERRGALLDSEEVYKFFAASAVAMRRIILDSPLPPESQDAILKELHELKNADLTKGKR